MKSLLHIFITLTSTKQQAKTYFLILLITIINNNLSSQLDTLHLNYTTPSSSVAQQVILADPLAQDIKVASTPWSFSDAFLQNQLPGSSFAINLGNGDIFIVQNYQPHTFSTTYHVSDNNESSYVPYQLPGEWAFTHQNGELTGLMYSSQKYGSGYFTSTNRSIVIKTIIPQNSQQQEITIIYERPVGATAPTGEFNSIQECNLNYNPNFPAGYCDKYLNIALDSDKEYFALATGSTADKIEQVAVSLTHHAAVIENHLDYYFRIKLADNLGPYVPTGVPDAISDLSGVSIFMNSDGTDPYTSSLYPPTLVNGSGWKQLSDEWSFDEVKRGVDRHILHLFRGRNLSFSGKARGTNCDSEGSCSHTIFNNPNSNGLSVSTTNFLFDVPGRSLTAIHEIIHLLSNYGHTDDSTNCGDDSCPGIGNRSIMCSSGAGLNAVADEFNRYSLTRGEQTFVRNALNNCTDCHCQPLSMRDCPISNNVAFGNLAFDNTAPLLDCGENSIVNVQVEICSDCFDRDYDFTAFIPDARFNVLPNPNINVAGPSAGTFNVSNVSPISITAGQCEVLDFDIEFISINTSSQQSVSVELETTTVIDGHQNIGTSSSELYFSRPLEWVGGSLASPIPISQLPQNISSNIGYTINASGVILVNEDFIEDGVSILFSPGAKLIIPSGSQFKISNSLLSGCSNIWDGIEVHPGGVVNIVGSKVEDAVNAIEAEDGSTLKINNTNFLNNRTALHLPGTSNGMTTSEIEFVGNTVEVDDNSPHFPLFRTYGILANKQPSLNVICSPGLENEFKGLSYGIHLTDCQADLRQNRFRNINRVAIYAEGNTDAPFSPRLFNSGTFGSDPAIKYCRYGVQIEGEVTSFTLFQTIDECFAGIVANTERTTFIQNNILEDIFRTGISAGNQTARPSTLVIRNNNVELQDVTGQSVPGIIGMDAIRVLSHGGSNRRTLVYGNVIENQNFSGRGINLVDVRTAEIRDNTISIEQDALFTGVGIEVQGGEQNLLTCNDIGNINTSATQAIFEENIGILVTGSQNIDLTCNQINNTSVGAEFRLVNLGTNFATNEFNEHYYGLKIGHDIGASPIFAAIGVQNHTGNTWLENASGFQAFLNNPNDQSTADNRFNIDQSDCQSLFAVNN